MSTNSTSSNPQNKTEEGSPIWVIVLVVMIVLAVAVIIEIVHYAKVYIKQKQEKQLQITDLPH